MTAQLNDLKFEGPSGSLHLGDGELRFNGHGQVLAIRDGNVYLNGRHYGEVQPNSQVKLTASGELYVDARRRDPADR